MTANLRGKTFLNVGYMTVARLVIVVMSFTANIVLAQNLSSSDFGIVGFAMIFISFMVQFRDLGIGSALIRKSNLDEAGLYTGFAIILILGFVLCLLTFIISPLAKIIFDNDAVVILIKVLSINFLIYSFSFIPNCMLTRELNYKKLFIPQVCSAIIGSGTSIVLALSGFKYWSLVIASLCTSFTTALVLNILKPVRIKLRFDIKQASEFIHFGGYLFLSGLAAYVLFNIDNFMIGTVKGARELGYYALAFNWGSMVCSLLSSTILSVLFPTFSKIQRNLHRLKSIYLRILEYISFIGILVNLILLLVAEEFLFHILGRGTDKWLPALNVFRVICVYGIIRSLFEPVGSVFLALGRPNILFRSNVIAAALQLVLLYPAVIYFGIEGVAIIMTISYASQYLVCFPYLKREFNLSYSEVWKVLKPAITSACFIVIFMAMYSKIFRVNSIFFMIQKIFIGTAGFVLFHGVITKWKFIKETMSIVNDIKSKKI